MRSKDCRHYSRRELIEIIYELERREEKLERRLEKSRTRLKDRSMRVAQAGTLAEISAVIAGLFEAADETASLYLTGVKARAEGATDLDREGKAS